TITSGTLTLNNAATTVASLTGAGNLAFANGHVLTVGDSTSTTFSGGISGAGGLTKTGGGKLTLTGANTYTADTTINQGTLALSGTATLANSPNIALSGGTFDVSGLSSTFTLGASQTLKGNGNVTGPFIANGAVSPGASIGTLTFSSSLTLGG